MNFPDIDPGYVIISVMVLLFSLSIHEMAHAWVADRLGDPTARALGRVTLNPMSHIDPVGTILFPLLGLLSGFALFGWARPVPVNTLNLKNPKRDHLMIAAAGPLSNLIAGVVFFFLLKSLSAYGGAQAGSQPVLQFLFDFSRIGLVISVILTVFNLIPIPPLDGSWILSGLLPDQFSTLMDSLRPYSFLLLILLLWSGVFSSILVPILSFIHGLVL